jgi:hypothetical protein
LLESPWVDRSVLETSLVLLRQLEGRLEFLSVPVTPLAMLQVNRFAESRFGPLSSPERTRGLPAALVRTLAALEE